MNPDYLDGNVANLISSDDCHWYGVDGLCHDPDQAPCPLEYQQCCWSCKLSNVCEQACEAVRA